MTNKIVEPPFAICRWMDAWGDETGEATVANAHETHKATPMETAGWVLKDDQDGVSIFCERCTEKSEYVYRGRTFVPRGMVVELVKYKLTRPRLPKPKPPT